MSNMDSRRKRLLSDARKLEEACDVIKRRRLHTKEDAMPWWIDATQTMIMLARSLREEARHDPVPEYHDA